VAARRGLVVLVLALWALAVVVWAARPWSDTHPLLAPPDAKVQQATYECGPTWGNASVRGPNTTPYPVIGTPCGHREERRRVAAVDLGAAALGIGLAVGWRRSPFERRLATA